MTFIGKDVYYEPIDASFTPERPNCDPVDLDMVRAAIKALTLNPFLMGRQVTLKKIQGSSVVVLASRFNDKWYTFNGLLDC